MKDSLSTELYDQWKVLTEEIRCDVVTNGTFFCVILDCWLAGGGWPRVEVLSGPKVWVKYLCAPLLTSQVVTSLLSFFLDSSLDLNGMLKTWLHRALLTLLLKTDSSRSETWVVSQHLRFQCLCLLRFPCVHVHLKWITGIVDRLPSFFHSSYNTYALYASRTVLLLVH